MKDSILVINCGSSSLKLAILECDSQSAIVEGIADRLGSNAGELEIRQGDQRATMPLEKASHKQALIQFKEWLSQQPELLANIRGIGHRVVHGGESFKHSVKITKDVLSAIERCSELAPLHNPANLKGIKVSSKLFKGLPQVAVFDTAFHQTMNQEQFLFPIPMRYYRHQGLRRYGFHGTSFRYISQRLATLRPESENRGVLVAHLGNGASTCAIQDGRSVDTSMGLTPLDGLMMGTRSGSVDPGLLEFMCLADQTDLKETLKVLNKESGLMGISELSNDCRTLEEAMRAGDERAKLAIDMFCYRAAKNLLSVATALKSIDYIVFTGGIGENSVYVRHTICHYLKVIKVQLDENQNRELSRGMDTKISSDSSVPEVWVIPTNEELMIALDTVSIMQREP